MSHHSPEHSKHVVESHDSPDGHFAGHCGSTHAPLEQCPSVHPCVKHCVPSALFVHALPHELATWHEPHPTGVHPDPVQHVPPQPSEAPHVLPEQLGVQQAPLLHTPLGQVVPLAMFVQAEPHAFSVWQLGSQLTGVQPDPAQQVPLQPSPTPQAPLQVGVHTPPASPLPVSGQPLVDPECSHVNVAALQVSVVVEQ